MSKNEKILSLRAALAQQITDRTHNEQDAREIAGQLSSDFIELFGELELVRDYRSEASRAAMGSRPAASSASKAAR